MKRLHWIALTLLLTSCASLPANNKQVPGVALADNSGTTWAKGIEARRRSQGVDNDLSGMLLLNDGVDAFVARVALARLAEKTLDVQYYLYHSDLSGQLLTAELWKAAERGVRVRVLLDDMDMSGKDKDLSILNAHPNLQIRLFNPFIRGKSRAGQFVTRFGSVTRRAHNKAMIADNAIGIVGGRNVGDEYFGANPNMAFGDLDVALTSPAAGEISTAFDLYWNSALAYPVETLVDEPPSRDELNEVENRILAFYEANSEAEYLTRLENSDILKRAREGKTRYYWGTAAVLYDHPNKISSGRDQTEFHLAPRLVPFFNSAQRELLVISPYFVPGKSGVEFLVALQQRGVNVQILTNSLMSNDVPVVHAGYSRYRKQLLEAGIRIFEFDKAVIENHVKGKKLGKTREGLAGSKASLHAKYYIVDRKSTFIGSLNLDPRSVIENTEIGVVIDDEGIANDLATNIDEKIRQVAFEVSLNNGELTWEKTEQDGTVTTFNIEPYSTWWDRFSVWFMRLLPGESQL